MYSKFPLNSSSNADAKLIANRLFGNRIFKDQTLYEYLIEFLLIFVSAKDDKGNGKMQFHDNVESDLYYYFKPNMGLRRFIFFNKNQKDKKANIDVIAYEGLIDELKKNVIGINNDDRDNIINSLQDLLKGYSVITKKRSWCAKNVLPLAPELIFCSAMPNDNNRKDLTDVMDADSSFNFDQRNFLARGGEVYYLHLLQYLLKNQDDKDKLTDLLRIMFKESGEKFSLICNFINESWENYLKANSNDPFDKRIENIQHLSLSFIPEKAYEPIEKFSVDELINYLSCKINPINKIDILAYGVMLQIIRMMNTAVTECLEKDKVNLIIDMKSNNNVVKKLSSDSYTMLQDLYMEALNKTADDMQQDPNCSIDLSNSLNRMKELHKAKENSFDILKSKAKEMKLVIPVTGGNERFSMSENIVRFLVLSLIEPNKKMTTNMFLEKIYQHYGFIIGPVEYRKYAKSFDSSLTSSFEENLELFEKFLKNTGFLRELSDATSVVENPYEKII